MVEVLIGKPALVFDRHSFVQFDMRTIQGMNAKREIANLDKSGRIDRLSQEENGLFESM